MSHLAYLNWLCQFRQRHCSKCLLRTCQGKVLACHLHWLVIACRLSWGRGGKPCVDLIWTNTNLTPPSNAWKVRRLRDPNWFTTWPGGHTCDSRLGSRVTLFESCQVGFDESPGAPWRASRDHWSKTTCVTSVASKRRWCFIFLNCYIRFGH